MPYGTPPLVPSNVTAYFRQTLAYWTVYRLAWSYDYDGSHFAFDTHIGEIAFPGSLPDWLFDETEHAHYQKAQAFDILYNILNGVPMPSPSWY